MPSEELLNELQEKYKPIVKRLIESEALYMNIDETINLCFVWDDHLSITGTTNRKTNLISFNLAYVDKAYSNNRLYDVEHFLIHEMRHVFQHIKIRKYKNNEDVGIDPKYVERWIKEGQNYVASLDKEGKENPEYFKQDCELDAYAFSFAVMHHKYRGKYDGLLYVPSIYKNELKEEFDSAVEGFLDSF